MSRLLSLFLLVAVTAAASPAWAQRQAPSAERLDQAIERLSVSDATAAALRSALAETDRTPGALWAVSARLHAELTPEQRAELVAAAEAQSAQRRARLAERPRQGARGEARPQRRPQGERPARAPREGLRQGMQDAQDARAAALNLTAEQQARLATLQERHREQLSALRSEAQQDRTALREQMQRFRAEAQATHAEILTPRQQEVLEIHRALQSTLMGGPGPRGSVRMRPGR
jgi:hypothetical protein